MDEIGKFIYFIDNKTQTQRGYFVCLKAQKLIMMMMIIIIN